MIRILIINHFFSFLLFNTCVGYRQLVQQYAKNLAGETVSPAVASAEAKAGKETKRKIIPHFTSFHFIPLEITQP